MLSNNWLALIITLVISLTWLRFIDFLAHKGLFSPRISRKIIHIGTGPIFVLCWLLFPLNQYSRYFAAVVPLGITLQFALVGFGIIKDQPAVDAMSRTGDPREILKGPLIYGLVFVLLTTIFWYSSPIAIIALMILCGGDGMADLVGKKFGTKHLPWSPKKTFMGSLAVFIGGGALALILILIFTGTGNLPGPFAAYLLPVGFIGLTATLIESLPIADVDNFTVPLVSALLGILLF